MKKVMRKVGAMLLAASMTVSLAACGSSKDEQSSGKGADEQITLTIWHQSVADTDPVKKIIEDSVEEYHELHPNITIEQDGVTGEQYKTKIKTAFAAREAPDISYMFSGGSFVKPYIDASYLLPIDDYVSEETLNSVLPGMLDGCTFDDKLYTLPTVTFLANLYCNTEMFEKAGAKIPTTWEELLDAVDKLNAAGYTPMILGEKDRWPGMYMYDIISARTAGNAGLEEAFGDPSKFNSKPFIEAAEKLQ